MIENIWLISYELKVYEKEIIACILSNFSIFKEELREVGALNQETKGKHFRICFCEHTHTNILLVACMALFS